MRPRFWLIAILLAAVVFTGCLKNPVTGKVGPSWNVPVEVPLISGEVTVQELASDYLEAYLPEEYNPNEPLVLEFSDTAIVDVAELGEAADLPFESFTVDVVINQRELVDEVTRLELPLDSFVAEIGDISKRVGFPVSGSGTIVVEEDVLMGFTELGLDGGTLEIVVINESGGSLNDVKVAITGIVDPLSFGSIANTAQASNEVPLPAVVRGDFNLTLEAQTSDTLSGNIVVELKLKNLQANHVVDLEQDNSIQFSFDALVEGLDYDAVTFAAGAVGLTLDLVDEGVLVLDSAKIGGQDLLAAGLADVKLENGVTKVTLAGEMQPSLGGRISTLPAAQRQAEARLQDVRLRAAQRRGGFDEVSITQSISDWETDFEFTSLNFADGKLTFSFAGLTKGELVITGVTMDGQELSGTDNQFSLAGVTISRAGEVVLIGEIVGEELEFAGEDVTAQAEFSDLKLTELALVLEKQEIDAAELDIDPVSLDFDWGQFGAIFDWISHMENTITVMVDNPSGLPLDLRGLELVFTGKGGAEYTISLKDAHAEQRGTATVYTVSSNEWVDIFRSEPQSVHLAGYFVVGNDEEVLIDPDAEIAITLKAAAQAVITIDYDQDFAQFVLEAQEVAQQAELDKGLDFVSQPGLFAEVTNGIPLGVQIWLDLSASETDWDDATTIDLGVIPAAEVDSQGRARAPRSGLLELPVNDEVQAFLRKGGFMRVRIVLAGDRQTGMQQIAITPADSVEYRIWAHVSIKVNQ